MRGDTVADALGVVHRTQGGPEPFTTIAGGIPGRTWCGALFYDATLGPGSCTIPVEPMTYTEGPVNCMSCLVRECR